MFGFKKRKKPEPVLFEVSVFAKDAEYAAGVEERTEELMDRSPIVATLEFADLDEVHREEIEDIRFRFPEVDTSRLFFLAERLTEPSGPHDTVPAAFCTNDPGALLGFLKDAEAAQPVT